MGNRRKAKMFKLNKKKLKFSCPKCKGTDFDVSKNYGEKDDVMYDALSCRNCPWSGAVPSHKIRSVQE